MPESRHWPTRAQGALLFGIDNQQRFEAEFAAFRAAIEVPLLANMTEFGKSPLLSTQQLTDLGYNMAIIPVTALRLAMRAVEEGFRELAATGTQRSTVDNMPTRRQHADASATCRRVGDSINSCSMSRMQRSITICLTSNYES